MFKIIKAKKILIFSLMILLVFSFLLVGCGAPEDTDEFDPNGQTDGINSPQEDVNPFEGEPAPSPGMDF